MMGQWPRIKTKWGRRRKNVLLTWGFDPPRTLRSHQGPFGPLGLSDAHHHLRDGFQTCLGFPLGHGYSFTCILHSFEVISSVWSVALDERLFGRHKVLDTLGIAPSCQTVHSIWDEPDQMFCFHTVRLLEEVCSVLAHFLVPSIRIVSFRLRPHLSVTFDVVSVTWSGAYVRFLRNTFDFSLVFGPSRFGPKPWSCRTIVSCPLSRV